MSWIKATVAAVSVLALVGCFHRPVDPPPPFVHVAKQACEIDSLAREHLVVLEKLERTDVSETVVSEKMREFRAEVDASYRFVVENCTAYNLCMQTHGYVEERCDRSRDSWEASHRRFNELTTRLAEIERWRKPRPHNPHPWPRCGSDDVFAAGQEPCGGSGPNENY